MNSKETTKNENAEWYAVPPYRNEGWQIFNGNGELVAIFETKDDCLRAVESVKKDQTN